MTAWLRRLSRCTGWLLLGLALAWSAGGQPSTAPNAATEPHGAQERKQQPSAGKEMASGAGNIGTGVAKGAGHLAKGTAKGAGDLATLHPVDAGVSLGKGAAGAGKDVTVGAAKGSGKITKGIGRVFKKVF